ncbi:MAG: NADH-quinone oxidoreductase subunit J [Actinobacteria bacterium]|jgi:NADH-quinone oxidoreductase subunit J|nr:NADH-quinone oxidoreductase subunit J [Actinomycetota bacterium]MBT3745787.1 NADH-quinone oxidoreductase subunit J [Actinomycetota bacterium]MBT3969022.1 NADH-quinone oxidoreductase subunit J [Actinomycetota bacterium]MBT4010583.1 NADH-quinone oxidoreductase subunit J [Actinomycetota bacterium]MBT4302235.1 NADH-quinone oxidoreductase subunit J [Actinomycetota bacterium]
MDAAVFLISAVVVLSGAVGVLLARNPIHAALFLIETLFGIAVLFILLDATFLAAVQVVVYAGAIVILFLFVIMLLGVDRADDLGIEPIAGQRPMAAVIGASLLGLTLTTLLIAVNGPTGDAGTTAVLGNAETNTRLLGEALFTDHVFAVELTALLLTVAIVGAVVLARRISGPLQPLPGVAIAVANDQETEED